MARRTAVILSCGLLVAACGSSGKPSASKHTGNSQPLAFSNCMRSHGVSNWPDPESNGTFDKTKLTPQKLGATSSQIHAAGNACQHLFPSFGSGMTSAQFQQMKAQALRFSRCIRAHGVPNYPDPGPDGREPEPASVGINDATPKFQAALKACPPT